MEIYDENGLVGVIPLPKSSQFKFLSPWKYSAINYSITLFSGKHGEK